MLEYPALPSWKFSSPIPNPSMESSPNISPSSQPLPIQKIPLKTSVHFPITITICKHWSKFVTCSPSHGDFGGVSRPQRHSYNFFDYVEKNGCLRILIRWLWENNSRARGPRCPPIFWSLRKGTINFHFR